jgi:hypothetical protein
VRKSCSRALKAFARVRPNAYNSAKINAGTITNPLIGSTVPAGLGVESCNDSFRSEQSFPFKEYQWQLGSLYFPQQPVTGGSSDTTAPAKCAVSAYAHLLEAVDKFHDNAAIFNTFKEIPASGYYSKDAKLGYVLGNVAPTARVLDYGFTGQATTLAVTLERSTMFNLAGVPVNNSRVLALRAKLHDLKTEYHLNNPQSTAVTSNTRQLNIFLKYVKLARVFLNNVEVEQ